MQATLYRADGRTWLTVGDPDGVGDDAEVVSSDEIGFDAAEVYAFLTEQPIGTAPEPTIEEVTNAFDPWLAWFGGSSQGSHAVLYGRRGDYDRKVSLRRTDGEYEVTLQFGVTTDVPNHEFEPADVPPLAVTTTSKLHAKRTFYDWCAVE